MELEGYPARRRAQLYRRGGVGKGGRARKTEEVQGRDRAKEEPLSVGRGRRCGQAQGRWKWQEGPGV